ncbi:endonuclease Q family protein [Halomarina litorea]|uniref:endonuclease Q family protein n=1 Tax=Halomarina litorea TaxID=2961595 RepID=UPI0020C40573|nr:endonuclease Q family protein [Halomarina sp. BCD28]
MGLLARVMGTDDGRQKYRCSACQEIFTPDGDTAESALRCPVCGDRNVTQFD